MDGREKRRHKRVHLPYVIKFHRGEIESQENWDAVNPINMSESGMCFLTTEAFVVGTEMQLFVANPALEEEYTYYCKVLRSEKSPGRPMFYETVVTIEDMDDNSRKAYLKLLQEYIDATEKDGKDL